MAGRIVLPNDLPSNDSLKKVLRPGEEKVFGVLSAPSRTSRHLQKRNDDRRYDRALDRAGVVHGGSSQGGALGQWRRRHGGDVPHDRRPMQFLLERLRAARRQLRQEPGAALRTWVTLWVN